MSGWDDVRARLDLAELNEVEKMSLQPTPTSAEFDALADEYQTGLEKCAASGYEEYGPNFQRRHQMVIAALRAASSLRALAELPPKPDWVPHKSEVW